MCSNDKISSIVNAIESKVKILSNELLQLGNFDFQDQLSIEENGVEKHRDEPDIVEDCHNSDANDEVVVKKRKKKHKHYENSSENNEFSVKKHKKKHRYNGDPEIILTEEDGFDNGAAAEKPKEKHRKEIYEDSDVKEISPVDNYSNNDEVIVKKRKKKHKYEVDGENNELSVRKHKKKHRCEVNGDLQIKEEISFTEDCGNSEVIVKKHKKKKQHTDKIDEEPIKEEDKVESEVNLDLNEKLLEKKKKKKKKRKREEELTDTNEYPILEKKKKHKIASELTTEEVNINKEETVFQTPENIAEPVRKKKKKKKITENGDSLTSEDGRTESGLSNQSFTFDVYEDENDQKKTSKQIEKLLEKERMKFPTNSHIVDKSETPEEIHSDIIDLDELIDNIEFDESSSCGEDIEKKLGRMFILNPYIIPPLHLIETSIVRKSPEQKEMFNNIDLAIKTGNYTKKEDELIKSNWMEFCKTHDWDVSNPAPFLNHISLMPVVERVKFGRFLAHGLDNRLLNSVYKRFRRLYRHQGLKSGRFTPKEDRIIIEFLQKRNVSKPFQVLGKMLNRDNLAVEKRSIKLLNESYRVPVRWDSKNAELFLDNLLAITKCYDVSELKDRPITTKEWKKLSKRLNVPVLKLQNGWNNTIYGLVFTEKKIPNVILRKKLINYLIELNVEDWRDISWSEVAKNFPGYTGLKLNKMLKTMVSEFVADDKRNDLGACLGILQDIAWEKVYVYKMNSRGFKSRKKKHKPCI